MNQATVYWALYAIWALSEVAIFIATRTKRGDGPDADRGSLWLLWIAIVAAMTLCRFADQWVAAPMFGGAGWVGDAAIVLLAAALALRWAAIAGLGKAFTVNVTIQETQTLKTDGLYSLVRHPSYTGLELIFVAIGLYQANWAGFAVAIVPTSLALFYRIHVEEAALRGAFGADYEAYSRRTKRLIPFVY